MRKKTTLGLVLVFLLGLAAYAATTIRSQNSAQFINPRRGEIVEAIYGLGKVKARRRFEVKIGILTDVQKVFVNEGDSVKKGAPLIQFSESGLFRAPFDGVITLVAAEEGETVVPQAPVVRLEDLSDKYVEVSLEQQGALRIQKGQRTQIVFESLRGEKLEGQVATIFSKNDEFLAHIEVTGGLQPNVLPGMTADVAISVAQHENALLVPVAAINNGQVIVLRGGKRLKVPLKIGAIDGQMAQVIEGDLTENDQVLIGKAK